MSGPRWTLRQRLWAIVALTFLYLVSIFAVDAITSEHFSSQLNAIEQDYVPLLKFGPTVQSRIEVYQRGLQDAVAAQDRDALDALGQRRTDILALLDAAPSVVDRTKLAAVRNAFLAWADASRDMAERLIAGETGEGMIEDIAVMQERQRQLFELLPSTIFLDENALTTAFGNIRRAQGSATLTRTLVRLSLFFTITLMMLFIGRRVLSSFSLIQIGFRRFGRGQFDEPVVVDGDDELAGLAQGANHMAAKIGDLQRGLERERHELAQANRELESFSYSVSHDLRAPLRGIDGFSQALLEDCYDQLDDSGRDYLQRVRAAAQRMGELIDDLLNLSRIGRAEVERTRIELGAIARELADELQRTDPERQVEWVIGDGIWAHADRRLLAIVLQNLLGNAWKFSSKKPSARIELGCEEQDGEAVYFVRDDGAGFDEAYRDKLFGAFQRLHQASDFEGTGIGLATVYRIVRKHSGRIWAQSKVGEGATFFFTLGDRMATRGDSGTTEELLE